MSDALFLGHDTPQKLYRARCLEWAQRPALRHKRRGIWHTASWNEYWESARAAGLALAALGVARGEVVTVLAENRPEWLYVDMGTQCMGMIGNGAYPTSSADQVRYILQDSQTRVVVVENEEQLDKVLAVRDDCPALAKIVVIDLLGLRDFADPQVIDFATLMQIGAERAASAEGAAAFESAIDAGRADDVAFLVYTSGTTGRPKGAMISNRNMTYQVGCMHQYTDLRPGEKTLSFLPLCHIAERNTTSYMPLRFGNIVHFPENSSTVFNDIREVAPHMVFAPPRFWEKLHSQVVLFMNDAIGPARRIYGRAVADGRQVATLRLAGRPVPALLALRFALLSRLAFSNVRRFLGLDNIRNALTGAAPVAPELLEWYLSMGISLLELYGMTEASGLCTATPPDGIRLGYAGVRAEGSEVRIGPEGEILVRGPNVFAGYWRQPGQTAQAIDADGWLHTGDVGEMDGDGYLAIRDRLKDIIITSGGKNITPTSIENLLKFSPWISDAMVIGESRRFVTALVMIDHDSVARFAQERQVPFTDFASLTRAAEVVELIRGEVERANAKLARVEQVKDFRIIDQLLTAEDEELTPTMKLKRRVVAARYAELISTMYPE